MDGAGPLPPRPATRFRREPLLLAGIFLTALALRLIAITQLSSAPFFDDPFGDSALYYQRALGILRGDWLGSGVYFHSSPPYPYLIALLLGISGRSFFFLYAVQAVIGSGNCLLIYHLAKRLAPGILPATLAGICAALYGLLAFFDTDVLMIFLTLFCVDLGLLLLLSCRERDRPVLGLWAGLCFGVAAVDKTNLLTFVPVALFFLASGFSIRPPVWRWRPAALFLAGLIAVIAPVTARNFAVGGDLVLVSSNGGVNFFIGNNPESTGVFKLPEGSGLRDPGLAESSMVAAERFSGRKLKPSEASRFWAGRAVRFMREEPGRALALLGRKALLLLNRYEIPNHMNVAFVATEFAPVLDWMPFGFGVVVPLALVGIAWRWRQGLSAAGRLYLAFMACYAFTLVAFFITERYRLPLVPLFIVFAAVSVRDFIAALKATPARALLFWGVGLSAGTAVVFLPTARFRYTLDRVGLASRYYEKAVAHPERRTALLEKAIEHYRWALEVEPNIAFGHADLGLAYDALGYYSGSAAEFETAVRLDPAFREAAASLSWEREKARRLGDQVGPAAVPKTPFEEARGLLQVARVDEAVRGFRDLVRRDPFHYEALRELGRISLSRGDPSAAAGYFKKGLSTFPDHVGLLQDLAEAKLRLGRLTEARELLERGARLQPDDRGIRRRLEELSRRGG